TVQGFDQLDKSFLPLRAHYEVDIRCVQSGIRIQRRKVAPPHRRDAAILFSERAAQRNGGHHLGSRHHRHRKKRRRTLVHEADECLSGTWVHVAVDDLVFFLPVEHCRQRQYRKRKPTAARAGRLGMQKEDHDPVHLLAITIMYFTPTAATAQAKPSSSAPERQELSQG